MLVEFHSSCNLFECESKGDRVSYRSLLSLEKRLELRLAGACDGGCLVKERSKPAFVMAKF